jgi:hypothetical protein
LRAGADAVPAEALRADVEGAFRARLEDAEAGAGIFQFLKMETNDLYRIHHCSKAAAPRASRRTARAPGAQSGLAHTDETWAFKPQARLVLIGLGLTDRL